MNNIERKIIKPKLGLLELAKQLGNMLVNILIEVMNIKEKFLTALKDLLSPQNSLQGLTRKHMA